MKRKRCQCLAMFLALLLLAACGKPLVVDRNTIYVRRKGEITGAAIVDNFDKGYYDAGELENYVNQRIEEYASANGEGRIEVKEFSVEGNVAKLYVDYAGYEDYVALNEVELFTGTVPQALAAGYAFDMDFRAVEDGQLSRPASRDEVIEKADYKVVILSEKVDVKVDGEILFASADYTSLSAKDTVSIALPEDAPDGAGLSLV